MMELKGIEATCGILRGDIEALKKRVADLHTHPDLNRHDVTEVRLEGANLPVAMDANVQSNLLLVFRNLEDARMRLGKAMQAIQGGVSILDRANEPGMEIDGEGNVVPTSDKK